MVEATNATWSLIRMKLSVSTTPERCKIRSTCMVNEKVNRMWARLGIEPLE